MKTQATALLLFLAVSGSVGATDFPSDSWSPRPNPIASPDAISGGDLSVFVGQYTKSFNYYLDTSKTTSELFNLLFESLLTSNPLTAEYEPGLASSWSISDDRKTFTFRIHPDARWSDGKPVTAADVAWTFAAVRDPANLTGVHKVSLESFDAPVILSSNEISFACKEVHWRNLGAIGSLHILPRHVMEGKDFNKINFEFPAVSGAYEQGEIKEGVYARFRRRADWWRRGDPRTKGTANFDTVTFRFYAERENAFEAFKKGQLDTFPVYTSRLWMNETAGEKFEKNWIVRQRIYNHSPLGFQGFAMNMRRPPFDDIRVRKAISHLIDREKMNRTLMFNQYFMQRSYFEDLYDATHPCPNPTFFFDKARARALLSEAGWLANPKTGLLEKEGQPLTFRFLTRAQSSQKFLAIFGEDLRDIGVNMVMDMKDWAAWSKDMDEYNFDITWAAWGSVLFKDPEGMWHSREATRPSGNNITGFSDPRADVLIDRQRTEFSIERRNQLCREIDGIVARQCPYALLWNINHTRMLYWNKFGTPPTVLGKFDDEFAAIWYWWTDPDSEADLKDAVANGEPLPARPDQVHFDNVFHP